MSARHSVIGVVYENDGYVFAPVCGMYGFRHAYGCYVAVSLIGKYEFIGIRPFDSRGDGRRPSVRRFSYVKIEIIVCENGATHRSDRYCLFSYSEFVYAFGDNAVDYSVPASGAIGQSCVFKAFRLR